MPIYMDRHDVSEEITAEHLAHLHTEDLKIQEHFGCKGMTYWFDDKRKTAFCLIEAPDANALKEMHNAAHGQVPHQIIEVEASIVESFLGRIHDPNGAKDINGNGVSEDAFRTIMVVKMDGLRPVQLQDSTFNASLRELNDRLVQVLDKYEGKQVKSTRYQYLSSFVSVTHAVSAALDIQSTFREWRKGIQFAAPILKIGLNLGAPVTDKKSIFEETIKLAERMCDMVRGEIVLSAEIDEMYREQQAKPLPETDDIFALTRSDEKFLTQLMDYADSTWSDTGLKVDDFSKPMGCSKSQLYRKLTQLTGKSPNAFIRGYRLNEALKLLNKRTGNISEIAFETGFTSPSYFSKCFQKEYGHQPSDYLSAGAK